MMVKTMRQAVLLSVFHFESWYWIDPRTGDKAVYPNARIILHYSPKAAHFSLNLTGPHRSLMQYFSQDDRQVWPR